MSAATAAAGGELRFPWEFNGVVRLTKIGTTYIVTTVVLAVAAINTGNNPLYIAVALMLGSLLLSGLASKGGLKSLEVEIVGASEAWAGRPSNGRLHVRNRSRIWNVRDVVLTSEAFSEPVLVPRVGRGETIEVIAPFLFRRRGLAHVHAIDSYTRYPFGFFVKKRRLPVTSEIVVFPRIFTDTAEDERLRPAPGETSTGTRIGTGVDIHSFRDYVHGDSLRHVHWKKSASIGRWITRQTESDVSRSVHVIVDPYRPHGVPQDRFEEMIASAATFIYHAAARGLDVTLSLPRMTVRARESESVAPLYRALALLEETDEPVVEAADRNSVVFSVAREAA